MAKQNNEPKPPSIPSVREDGTIDSNGVDLGRLNGWINSEDPNETPFDKEDKDDFEA